jgi:hypothetical protein
MKANPLIGYRFARALVPWLWVAAVPLLFSCAGTTMREHFKDYNTAYSDALNEQMLLNLARLQNGHPAYFLAIGAIDDRLTVSEQGTVGNSGNFSDGKSTAHNVSGTLLGRSVSRTLSSVFGYNASGSFSRSSSPEFNFIPLNNDAVAKQILQPIGPEVFYTLYQQGYPIDQLMRVMIERVETTLPNSQQLVLVNSPNGGSAESYARFLRACAVLRLLQLNGCLSLTATYQPPEKLGPVSFGGGAGKPPASGPSIKDYADASDKGWVLTHTNDDWQLGKLRETPVFTLNPAVLEAVRESKQVDQEIKDIAARTLTNSHISRAQQTLVPLVVQALTNCDFAASSSDREAVIADDVQAVSIVIGLLNEGISVQTKVSGEAQAKTRLVLRSYGRAMEAVAVEQPAFDALAARSTPMRAIVPDLEKHPVIRIDWSGQSAHLVPALETVHYAGKSYEVTDPLSDPLKPNAMWNRDVFRLLVALSSQVTVDISKFQQRVFELRTE